MAIAVSQARWSLANAPRLDGRVAIVTGAAGGLGYATALGLAQRGAATILAGRNPDKGARAQARIRSVVPQASVRFEALDLGSLASVQQFAAAACATHHGVIDILVNNAGVMGLPRRQITQDGFERQIGVNYLGHFALTARLKDALCAASGCGRVVNVASLSHRRGVLRLDDLQAEKSYHAMQVYAQSKLAMLVFAQELQRRAERNRWNLVSIAAHPGWARTDIIGNGLGGGAPGVRERLIATAFGLLAQSASDGALPLLYAATAPEAIGGGYYGPAGPGERRGPPAASKIFRQAADPEAGSALWALSEKLTGIPFQ